MSSLSDKAVGGVLWAGVEKFGGKAIQFATTIILARILTPEDYGIMASIIIIFALSQVLIDSGFSQALIREEKISTEDKSTTFYINFLVALVLSVVIWLVAIPISNFFEDPLLVDLTRFMAPLPILSSFSIVQRAHFIQKINFRTQAYIHVITITLSGIISIYAAVKGLGVWALAIQYLSLSLFDSLLFWIVNPWKPRGFISGASFKRLFGFGYKMMLSGVLDIIFTHLYKVIIRKLYLKELLGFYFQAENAMKATSQSLNGVLVKVNYTTLSKVKDDVERLKDAYIKTTKATSYFVFPAMTGLILVAEPFIVTAIGNKWLASVPILQVLSVAGLIIHLQVFNLDLLKVLGRSDLFLKLSVIKKIGVTIAIVIGIRFGFWGLIFAQVISSYVSLFINMTYTSKLLGYTRLEQSKDIISVFMYSIPMIVIVLAVDLMNINIPWLRLLTLVSTGATVYISMSLILKPTIFREIIYILRPTLKFLNKVNI